MTIQKKIYIYLFVQKVRNMGRLIKIRRNCIHTHELLHFTSMYNTDLGKWQSKNQNKSLSPVDTEILTRSKYPLSLLNLQWVNHGFIFDSKNIILVDIIIYIK